MTLGTIQHSPSDRSEVLNSNLYGLIEAQARQRAACPALILPDDSEVSYATLIDQVARISSLLKMRGVEPGDRIMVQANKSPDKLALYLATLKVGAIFVPLNSAYTASEIDYFRNDAKPVLFVSDPVALAAEAAECEPWGETIERSSTDLAALIYTSGTTGRSKGAMLSHGALAANALALIDVWGVTAQDTLLHALPIFHAHGLFISAHCSLLTGSPMLWLPKFDEDTVLKALPKATVMMGVPTFYTRLLADERFTEEAARPLRLFISGSAPLLESTFAEFEERTGHRILERYGMSEAMVIASNPLEGTRSPGSVGYPLPGMELRIAGGDDTGGIEIRGASLFSGYWDMPEKTAEEFTADGFFITGDVGRTDPDGRLWISGRSKDLIISGGYNVYPKEIELVLDEVPGVVESAVIGVPHPDFGEAVVAVLVGTADPDAVIAAARQQLASFKTPKKIIFLDELPRNAMGKVQKAALRADYAGSFA
ncbi:MAG: AMP-binding protein [Pseudomonadota bacterium]|jgi:malonyl-CoA/methylmalonyl-CoA synthetase